MRTIVSGSLMMNTVTSRTGLRPKISSKRFYDRGDARIECTAFSAA